MRALAASLIASLRAVWLALRMPAFWLALLLSLVAWGLAYQQKVEYTVDVGGPQDYAYVSGFYAQEKTPQFDYRWSRGSATVTFPGIGNEPVQLSLSIAGARPNLPSPAITVTVRGLTFPVQLLPELHTYAFSVPRGSTFDGDLTVRLQAPTFNVERSASSVGRDLGVAVNSVTVTPAENGLRPVVVPPVGTVGGLLAGMVLLALSGVVAVRRRWTATVLVLGLSAMVTVLVLAARMELGLLAPQMVPLGLWCLGLALVGRAVMDVVLADGSREARFVVGAGAAAFVLAFALRFGGMTYPQFLTSDLGLNIHKVQAVQRGEWLFTEPLPDGTCDPPQPNGTCVPYPPALYAIVAPMTVVFGSSDEAIGLLIEWTNSLLDAASCLTLAWAGYRLWRGRAGGFAALAYAVSPAPFELFSAGNHANLFGQEMLNIALLGGLVYLNGGSMWGARARRVLPVVGACLFLTMLGHYGMMLSALAIAAPFTIWVVYRTIRGRKPRTGWVLLGLFAAAFAASFLLYYRQMLDYMLAHWGRVLQRAGIGKSSEATPSTGSSFSLGKLWGKVDRQWSTPALETALGGLALARARSGAGALLGSWLLMTGLFALLDQWLGDAIRWYYLGAAALALLSGRYLGLMSARGRANRWVWLLAGLVAAAMLWHLLYIWVGDLIFSRYHS